MAGANRVGLPVVASQKHGLEIVMTTGNHGEVVRLLMEKRSTLFAFILAIVRDDNVAEEMG